VAKSVSTGPSYWDGDDLNLPKKDGRQVLEEIKGNLALNSIKLLIVLIADYEAKHFTIERASRVEVLKELMDTNGLRQKDLAEDLGGESVVSLILKEKRQLNRQQIEKLGSASTSLQQCFSKS
jgi:antitoxin component HigA of HigAB toxin-antitoxin module